VPQYILDSFVDRSAGAYCNIVVTQVSQLLVQSASHLAIKCIQLYWCHALW